MGDCFQTIVDRDVSLAEASSLGSAIRDWLIEEQVIASTPTDGVLGGNGISYPPGANFEQVLGGPDRMTRELRTNGLEIIVGRTVFHAGQFGLELICRKCRTTYTDGGPLWDLAVDEWYSGNGTGILACSACGNAESVTDWNYDPHGDSETWAFSSGTGRR